MSSSIEVSFPGGLRVDAQLGNHVIRTDQPASGGGEDSAPAPFDLFLASIATCAGIYALGYCRARNLSTEGLKLTQEVVETDPATKLPKRVALTLTLPPGFPEHHRPAILRAINGCKVKKTIAQGLDFDVIDASAPIEGRAEGETAHV
ncbi:MAG: OsmC family protein [Sandaracinaceae bacterium]|nr:OsmC family protein [Sandaracinaceae bacterium]